MKFKTTLKNVVPQVTAVLLKNVAYTDYSAWELLHMWLDKAAVGHYYRTSHKIGKKMFLTDPLSAFFPLGKLPQQDKLIRNGSYG